MALTLADIQAEFTASPCIGGLAEGQIDQLKVLLLWKSINGDVPMTHDDIQTLFTDSPCIGGLLEGQLDQITALLINAGGSGTGSVLEGDGPPVTPPINPATAAIYYDRVTGEFHGWNTLTQAWE